MARERRTAFGEVAELYDRARPSYPAELVDDVVALVPGDPPARALEVGAGTGKATVLFAQRGVEVHALEPLEAMAALAERNCERYPHVAVERTEFEAWDGAGATFDLIYSAQAWHWISPEVRYTKAGSLLGPDGVLAVFWNRPEWDANPLREQIDEAYERTVAELLPNAVMRPAGTPDEWHLWTEEIEASAGLGHPAVRGYPWIAEYSTEDYIRLLRSHSDHVVLDPGPREALYDAIASVIDAHGGTLELTYVTRLCLARACA